MPLAAEDKRLLVVVGTHQPVVGEGNTLVVVVAGSNQRVAPRQQVALEVVPQLVVVVL